MLKLATIGAVVCDYDRTLTDEGLKLSEVALEALKQVKGKVKLVLATGRTLDTLPEAIFKVFDLTVAENGALIYDPRCDKKLVTKPEGWDRVRNLILREVGDPTVEVGEVVLSYSSSLANDLLRVLKAYNLDSKASLQFNRDRVMVLPAGVEKGSGLSKAAEILGVDASKIACIGDGENDLPLFKMVGFKVAVANAVMELKREADYTCSLPDGEGVKEFLEKFLI